MWLPDPFWAYVSNVNIVGSGTIVVNDYIRLD